MKASVLVLLATLFAGCGGEPEKPAASAAALPITAPMQARERLLHDLDQQSALARGRFAALDETIDGDR